MLSAVRKSIGFAPESIVPACEETVARWASLWPTSLARRDLVSSCFDQSTRLEFGCFLHKELMIRFSQRAKYLQSLPYGLSDRPDIRGLLQRQKSFVASLESLPSLETPQEDAALTKLVGRIQEQQEFFETDLFSAFRDLMNDTTYSHDKLLPHLDQILHRAMASRIGTKMLMAHYRHSAKRGNPRRVGVVDLSCFPGEVARAAAKQCALVCAQELGQAPEIIIDEAEPHSYALIPGYLHYKLSELIKNACKATVLWNAGHDLPPVVVSVEHDPVGGKVKIDVRDRGGGMSPAKLERALKFLYTTSGSSSTAGGTELAGFGVGLPKSRLYARHFGDDLWLESEEGVGTEASLLIHSCGSCRKGPEAGFGSHVPAGPSE